MTDITISIPTHLQMSQFDLAMLVAAKLFEDGKLTSGEAAEMVGLSKRSFIELSSINGTTILRYNISEIENDLKNISTKIN